MPASGPIKPTLAPETQAPEDDCSSATSNDGSGLVFTAHAEPSGSDFAAPAAMPLLLAAQRAGLLLPSSCRNGTCRACICQLTSGRVAYRIDWPGLSAEEKREGWILPCVAYPVSDVVIRLDR